MSSVKTMKTWVSVLKSFEEIPSIFKSSFEELIPHGHEFPYTLFVPSGKWDKQGNNATLVFTIYGKLYFFEKQKKNVLKKYFNFSDISMIESGSVLLNSWFKVVGISEGLLTESRVYYNAVGDVWFEEIIQSIRETVNRIIPHEDLKEQQRKFDYLCLLDYKFMNYSRSSIISGENVEDVLFQPSIKKIKYKIFNKVFYKPVSNSHVNILSDKELIIIKDGDSKFTKFGVSRLYIPLQKINEVKFHSEDNGELIALTIELNGNYFINSVLEISNKANLEKVSSRLISLKAAAV